MPCCSGQAWWGQTSILWARQSPQRAQAVGAAALVSGEAMSGQASQLKDQSGPFVFAEVPRSTKQGWHPQPSFLCPNLGGRCFPPGSAVLYGVRESLLELCAQRRGVHQLCVGAPEACVLQGGGLALNMHAWVSGLWPIYCQVTWVCSLTPWISASSSTEQS